MQEQIRTLQVLEKLDPEPGTFGGPLDQAGNVGHDEATLDVDADDAEIRVECRKRIIGHPRTSGGERADECRLAGIGQPEQADICQQLQLQVQVPGFTGLARSKLARRAIHAAFKVAVSQATASAPGDEQRLAVLGQIA